MTVPSVGEEVTLRSLNLVRKGGFGSVESILTDHSDHADGRQCDEQSLQQ